MSTRRDFLKALGLGGAAISIPARVRASEVAGISIDPQPSYELSPGLYMQFMEPLGTTDGSVAAAWDFGRDRWRQDVIDVTRELAPSMIRWGGCFISYYRWQEGVGPRERRVPMLNMCWGGLDTNQVGTCEFVDFCQQTKAEPLMCVNFESDGRSYWQRDPKGSVRSAGPEEAAQWVRYCNNPDDALRHSHGIKETQPIKLWQIGNETSYDRNAFDCETAAKRTIAFAKAMRREDPDIKLIGWGDSNWGPKMLDIAGEHLQYIAFHHMFNPDRGVKNSPLRGIEYRKDPAWTWERLMQAAVYHEKRIQSMRDQVEDYPVPMALTECHFALPGRNRCDVLSTWAAGVANARLLNIHERHGDKLKIATLADFCGTRWQVNAIMIPVPRGKSFMMPVARVMSLYRHHTGQQAVTVKKAPAYLDVTASRTGQRMFLHVINTDRVSPVKTHLDVAGARVKAGRVFEMAGDPECEFIQSDPNPVVPVKKALPDHLQWSFPPASVSAVELDLLPA
jgi:alpha-L-arabinofuranosidase